MSTLGNLLANALETASSTSSTAARTSAGAWRRAAAAAEAFAGASTTANNNIMGYMRRTAVALEAKAGITSPTNPNLSRVGYLQRIAVAFETINNAPGAGKSYGKRLRALVGARPALPYAPVFIITGDSQSVGTGNDEAAARAAFVPNNKALVRNLAGAWVNWDPNGVTGLSFGANTNKIGAAIGIIEEMRRLYPDQTIYIIGDGFSGSFQGRSPVVATITASIAGNIATRTAGGAFIGDHLVTGTGVPLGTKTLFQATDANNWYVGKTGQTSNVNYTVASTSMDLRNGYLTWATDESTAYLGSGQTQNGVRKRVVDGLASLVGQGLTPKIVLHLHITGTNDKSLQTSADDYGAALDAFLARRDADWPMTDAITVMPRVGPDADAATQTVRNAQMARRSSTFRLIDTDSYTRHDAVHWTVANGLRDIGVKAVRARFSGYVGL